MLVKINLNESPTRNQGSMVGLPTKQIHSVHGRPTELGAGKKLLLLFSFKGITLLLYYSGVRFKDSKCVLSYAQKKLFLCTMNFALHYYMGLHLFILMY